MRTALITGTIFFFVLILIIVFQNISGGAWVYILFFSYTANSGYVQPMIYMALLGFLFGAVSTLLITSLVNSGKDEEAPGGANW